MSEALIPRTPEQKLQDRIARQLKAEFGPIIMGGLNDPEVTEIMANPSGEVWLEKQGRMSLAGRVSTPNLLQALRTIATSLNTEINWDRPIVEGELPLEGERFLGMIPPVTTAACCVIRKHGSFVMSLDDWVTNGSLRPADSDRIKSAIKARTNIVVAGGTGSGKTTLLNAMLAEINEVEPTSRVLILEDTREVKHPVPNTLAMRTVGRITMADLLKASLRGRPDRILVGEVRGGEALTMLKAWTTGHPGGICTIHADSVKNAELRLRQMCAEVVVSEALVKSTVQAAVGLYVLTGRRDDGSRGVFEIGTPSPGA